MVSLTQIKMAQPKSVLEIEKLILEDTKKHKQPVEVRKQAMIDDMNNRNITIEKHPSLKGFDIVRTEIKTRNPGLMKFGEAIEKQESYEIVIALRKLE